MPNLFSQMYVFGDSLSDTGTVFRATNGMFPPQPAYFEGRYSNGRVWVEYLAERLQLSTSPAEQFACGGATTTAEPNSLVPGVLTQVQTLLQQTQVHPQALCVLWAGANDYLQGMHTASIPVANLMDAIAQLTQSGARQLLVVNLPNLGEVPATRGSASAGQLSSLTQSHNQGLRRSLKRLRQAQPELQIASLDAYELYRTAMMNPATYGFTNVTCGCLDGMRPRGNPEEFLFWDGIHPTTATHRILADLALTALLEQGLIPASVRVLPGSSPQRDQLLT